MSIRQTFTDIADAIREKTGSTGLLYPSEMAQNILDIPKGDGGDNLPAFIDGTANFNDYASSIRNVTRIKDYAFMSNTTVVFADFPRVERIGKYAFEFCSNLQEIKFPRCYSIENNAFSNCSNLTEAFFPECSYIGSNAFANCSNLTWAEFPECKTVYREAFINCRSLTTAYFPKATSFSDNAFYDCVNLTSIEAPLLESVGGYAFYYCSKLSEVNFPLLKAIGSTWETNTFTSAGLKSVYFPLVSFVGAAVFSNCKSLTTVNLPNAYYMGNSVFKGCTSLETVTLGAYSYSYISSPSNLFSGCTNLKSIYVPSGALNYYQTSSWWSYWSDKIVPYDESDEYIYPYEYANNTEITEIPLSKQNATYVGGNAFLGCTSLKSVNLPNCRSIYSGMFSSHLSNSIEYVNIGVSWFYRSDFRSCSNLREIYAPNLVGYNEEWLFEGCNNLRIVSFPVLERLLSITLQNKGKLEVAYLPRVSMITQRAFYGCTNLRSVNLNSVLEIPEATFAEVSSLKVINLPACRTFASKAFQYCYGLKTVSAPNLKSWGSSAFQACPLESVYIGSNVTYVGGDCIPTSGSAKIYVPNDMVDTYKNGLFSSYSSMIYGY